MSQKLLELVKKIQFELKMSREEVAQKLGYTREHFYTLVKKNDPDTITKMFLAFPNELREGVGDGKKIAALETTIKVMWLVLIELKSKVTEQSTATVTLEMEAMIRQAQE